MSLDTKPQTTKYPRLPHLPWSPGGTRDDKRMTSASMLVGADVIMTEKLDGSSVMISKDSLFARSHSSPPKHPSFNYLKGMYSYLRFKIPDGMRLYAEYTYAVHSIEYDSLLGYLHVFDIWYEGWLDWEDVVRYARQLTIHSVPSVYRGPVRDEEDLREKTNEYGLQSSAYGPTREGLVLRLPEGKSVAKWVRAGYVTTNSHWKDQPIRRQGLAW